MSKLSIYNEYVFKEGKTYVYNLKYSNVISVNSGNKDLVIKKLESTNDKILFDLGFKTESINEKEETLLWYNSLKYRAKKLNVMIIMTYDCNCKCKYCFENLDNKFLSDTSKNIDKTCNFIISKFKNGEYKELDLHFFGGEPLLEIENIIRIYNNLKREIKVIKSNVITNGTLLNEKNIKEFKDLGIECYQITIDGTKEKHDHRRPMKNGKSGWDIIMNNIKILSKYNVSTSIRINIDNNNVKDIKRICKAIPEIFYKSPKNTIYMSPIVGIKEKNFYNTMKERAKNMKEAWKVIKDNELKVKITPSVYAPCPYHSIDSAFYIDLNGNIYTCGGFVGNEEKIEQVYGNKSEKFYERINYIPEDKCLDCPFFYVCMGGCNYEKEQLGNNCQKVFLKEIYDEYYTKYAE